MPLPPTSSSSIQSTLSDITTCDDLGTDPGPTGPTPDGPNLGQPRDITE
jgi:hypothetical protein